MIILNKIEEAITVKELEEEFINQYEQYDNSFKPVIFSLILSGIFGILTVLIIEFLSVLLLSIMAVIVISILRNNYYMRLNYISTKYYMFKYFKPKEKK